MMIKIQLFGAAAPPLYDIVKEIKTINDEILKELKSKIPDFDYIETCSMKIKELCEKK